MRPSAFSDKTESALTDHLRDLGIGGSHRLLLIIAVRIGFVTVDAYEALDPAVNIIRILKKTLCDGVAENIQNLAVIGTGRCDILGYLRRARAQRYGKEYC